MKNKKAGNILMISVIMLILNIMLFTGLFYFAVKKTGTVELEEIYAKKIAVILDSAEPGMQISFDVKKAFDYAEENKADIKTAFSVNDNIVYVKLSNSRGYYYSFFNSENVDLSLDEENKVLNIKVGVKK
ncbi:hypothetical protein COV15_02620 [Candidatus Woesearchaeota archaeon CG10_big_fil_rev_8_21_14_0_10_34_12]|nr:MAG: hypothetical protein COV15_02620 [Candidatus Woesearchaeota archaeon CG10_big_fil_rev_8_21_14_0_10_34_12]